jgi:sugar phosphate isomerase/epimerase
MQRRTFLTASASALAAQQGTSAARIRLGIDLFSIRDSGWSALEALDYAGRLGAQVVHFSELRFLGSLDRLHLEKIRARARELGIDVEIGMRSLCPSSKAFDPAQGPAEAQLERMLDAARILGSPLVRAFVGTWEDRTPGPIEKHIDNAVAVLRRVRSRALDLGVKIAIENHAGDMQARELKALVEAAGPEFTGVCLDSGNPLWAIEDPHLTLETLAPYVLTSHMRDSAVWRTPEGAAVAWTRMGEGNVNIGDYLNKYVQLCPGKPVTLEIIVTNARRFRFLEPAFWAGYRNTPAWEFSRFLALAERGQPRPDRPSVPKEKLAERQREDLEVSLRWTRQFLGV